MPGLQATDSRSGRVGTSTRLGRRHTGRSAAWLARKLWVLEVPGSNPGAPIRWPPPLAGRQALQQPFEDALERLLAVGVRPVVHRQYRDRHARAAAHEQRHLVVEESGAVSPPALEVELPAL